MSFLKRRTYHGSTVSRGKKSLLPPIGRAMAERLESRVLLTAVTFVGKGDGFSWSDPLNWSTGKVPTIQDDVTIGSPNNAQGVDIGSGNQAANSITNYGFIDVIQGASLRVTTTIQLASTSAQFDVFNSSLLGGTIAGSGRSDVEASTLDGVTLDVPTIVRT